MDERLILVCRILVGANFLVFGVNGFFPFLPKPQQTTAMQSFVEALNSARFIFPTVKVLEVFSGVCLLFNWMPRLAMIFLLPIVFGILMSQLLFNGKSSYGITAFTVIPYAALFLSQWIDFSMFLMRPLM